MRRESFESSSAHVTPDIVSFSNALHHEMVEGSISSGDIKDLVSDFVADYDIEVTQDMMQDVQERQAVGNMVLDVLSQHRLDLQ